MGNGDQFRMIDLPYWQQWQKRLKHEIENRVIEKLQVLDEHDLMYGYPPEKAKPAKVKPKPRKKGKRRAKRESS